jgi:hypothetical protein
MQGKGNHIRQSNLGLKHTISSWAARWELMNTTDLFPIFIEAHIAPESIANIYTNVEG